MQKFIGGEKTITIGEYSVTLRNVPYLVWMSKVSQSEGSMSDSIVELVAMCVVDALAPGEVEYEHRMVGPERRRVVSWKTVSDWPVEIQGDIFLETMKLHRIEDIEQGKS